MENADKKLEQLEKMFQLLDTNLPREEFFKAFEEVLKYVIAVEKRTNEEVDFLREAYQKMADKLAGDTSATLSDMKAQVDQVFVGEKLDEMKAMIEKKLSEVKDGKNGRDGKDGRNGRDGKDGLDGENGIDGVDGKDGKDGQNGRIVGGGRANNAMKQKVLTPDGSTKIFLVPKSVTSHILMSDAPNILFEGSGYTINATRTQITLTVQNAPTLGSQLLYVYSEVFNT